MNCLVDQTNFRLLDYLVGWDAAINGVENIAGLDSADGLTLKNLVAGMTLIDQVSLSTYLLPARIAQSCDQCTWMLVTPSPPKSRLLIYQHCQCDWFEPEPAAVDSLKCAVAIASSSSRIAVSDLEQKSLLIYDSQAQRLLAKIKMNKPGVVASASWREWLVVDEAQQKILRLDPAGRYRGVFSQQLPGKVARMAVDSDCRVWIATEAKPGLFQVWFATLNAGQFQQADLNQLKQAFVANSFQSLGQQGFCLSARQLEKNSANASQQDCYDCFNWYARPISSGLKRAASTKIFATKGQLLTIAIDSGIPRCQWHRIRIQADIPSATEVMIAVSSQEQENPAAQGLADQGWEEFNAGIPHPSDWYQGPIDSQDFLITQPPGRYLFVRIRMTGDGSNSPHLRRILIDYPRQTSLQYLPYVYRENPQAEDFSERFLSLFDAYINELDTIIERLPALLDVQGVAANVLPWLASFLDVTIDPAWDIARQRAILQALPQLYRQRGTVTGLKLAFQLLFDFEPIIEEISLQRPWAAVGEAVVSGGVRLFGRAAWRFTVGQSALSKAPIRSYGDPDKDPISSTAFRFRIIVPANLDEQTLNRIKQLLEAQKPAHTIAYLIQSQSIISTGGGINVGMHSLDSAVKTLVLGQTQSRLARHYVLASSKKGHANAMKVGLSASVGINSVME